MNPSREMWVLKTLTMCNTLVSFGLEHLLNKSLCNLTQGQKEFMFLLQSALIQMGAKEK